MVCVRVCLSVCVCVFLGVSFLTNAERVRALVFDKFQNQARYNMFFFHGHCGKLSSIGKSCCN